MLFTKESDYAIRVIRALQDGGKKTIKELCELEQIPSAFGYKILQKMNKSGSKYAEAQRAGISLQKISANLHCMT